MAVPLLGPKARFFNSDGDPLSGGKVQTYIAGTTTPLPTYTTAAGDVPNTNPVILDADGYANIWLGEGTYKISLFDANDVPIFTTDNYPGASAEGFGAEVFSITSTQSVTQSYNNSFLVATGNTSLGLLAAASAEEGFIFTVLNNGTGVVTLDPNGSETINGQATLTLYPGEAALVVCDGDEWFAAFKQNNGSASTKTANYTVALTDRNSIIECNATSGVVTLTLPAASSAGAGFRFFAKKTDATANAVVLDGSASETIDGATTFSLSRQYDYVGVICDGTTWHIISKAPSLASDTAPGIVELSTDAEFQTGTSTALAVTPANVKNSLGFADYFESAQQTITAGGLLTIAHGLARQPVIVGVELQCATAENGYSVGDRILAGPTNTAGGTSVSNSFRYDSTNIYVRYNNSGNVFLSNNAGTGLPVQLTNANWRVVVRAWA
jgi:hypothetical protein